MIAAVLLVPSEAHREALLGDGPCGSRAPMAWTYSGSGHRSGVWYPASVHDPRQMPYCGRALVLAWDGEPVASGLARLEHVANQAPYPRPSLATTHLYARFAQGAGLGCAVFLDADRREVTP